MRSRDPLHSEIVLAGLLVAVAVAWLLGVWP